MLNHQFSLLYDQKSAYALIWSVDDVPVGHCNVNKIEFGKEATMHLHMWQSENRQKGHGTALVRLSVPFFFTKLEIKELFCEPYALNTAPNRILEKVGFEFIKEYVTTPGSINFEQNVKRWRLRL